MNYDHRYHAGNFADVFKHVVLTRILLYLQRKPTPFRVIETHAGRGTYDLATNDADRPAEWRSGVARLDPPAFRAAAHELIAPYLRAVGEAVTGTAPYPGSPNLALQLTRPADRLLFCEMHPAALAALKACVGRDRRAKAIGIDGYAGLKAYIPPVERRGLVLIDPPFEAPDEFDRLAEAMVAAHDKWREGILMAWYPIKDRVLAGRFVARLARDLAFLRLELDVDTPTPGGRLASNGLVVVNAPYTLEREMTCLLPELRRQLAGDLGAWRVASHAASSREP